MLSHLKNDQVFLLHFVKQKVELVQVNKLWIAFTDLLRKKHNYIIVQCEKTEV
jgi:hypothetical protein